MVNSTFDQTTADILNGIRRRQGTYTRKDTTAADILAQAAYAPNSGKSNSQRDPFQSIPSIASRLDKTQGEFERFITSYATGKEIAVDKIKGVVSWLTGARYEPLGIERILERQIKDLEIARDDLGVLIDETVSVADGLGDFQYQTSITRKDTVDALHTLEVDAAVNRNNRAYLKDQLDKREIRDLGYHDIFLGIKSLDVQYAQIQRQNLRASINLNYQQGALDTTEGALETVQQGLLHAEKAHTEFTNSGLLIEELLPYFSLSRAYSQSMSVPLVRAQELTRTIRGGLAMSSSAFESFAKFSEGVGIYGQLPGDIGQRTHDYALRAQRGAEAMFSDIAGQRNAILSKRGM